MMASKEPGLQEACLALERGVEGIDSDKASDHKHCQAQNHTHVDHIHWARTCRASCHLPPRSNAEMSAV